MLAVAAKLSLLLSAKGVESRADFLVSAERAIIEEGILRRLIPLEASCFGPAACCAGRRARAGSLRHGQTAADENDGTCSHELVEHDCFLPVWVGCSCDTRAPSQQGVRTIVPNRRRRLESLENVVNPKSAAAVDRKNQLNRVNYVLIGQVAALGPEGVPSGINKCPVSRSVEVLHEGIAGDAQGDLKVHGGPEKALHHYPMEHYAVWRERIGPHALLTAPGAFGENLSTFGVTEKDVAVGDTFRLGSSLIQVSQGRQPCWKLNLRFDVPAMATDVQKSGMTGWYYRVLEEGMVAPGSDLILIDRVAPEWTIERLWRALYVNTMNLEELAAIAELPFLPEKWRGYAARRLASRKVEDWSSRLTGKRS